MQLGDRYSTWVSVEPTASIFYLTLLRWRLIPEYRTLYTHRQIKIKLHIRGTEIVTWFKI